MNAKRPEMSKLEGHGALAFYCGVAAKETEMICKALPNMVDTTGIEALIVGSIQFCSVKDKLPILPQRLEDVS
jgi:hypothetical protein